MKDKLKSNWHWAIVFLFILSAVLACNSDKKESHDMNHNHSRDTTHKKIYWCPMDTQIVQDKPGICHICDMDLELKAMNHDHHSMNVDDWVYRPVNTSVLSSIKSVKPVLKFVPVKIKTSGYITYDERRINNISARIGGRIEKLYVKYKYQPVTKGQILFEIYSHELQTAQQEYLYLKRNEPEESELLQSAKRKLLLLGLTEGYIKEIKDHDHVHLTTKVYSSYSGFVIDKEDKKSISPEPVSSMGGMTVSNSMTNSDKEISIREGSYVDKGETVFRVANTDIVWGIFEVYSNQLSQIKLNQTVHIVPENSDEMIMGKIDFIEPSYKESSGTAKLRVYLNNKEQNLKIGNLLSGEIEGGDKKGLWIPKSSVYDLGVDKVVFIKRNGAFETKKIALGYSADNELEVVSGLTEGEEIAENAQFMVDSESFVKVSK